LAEVVWTAQAIEQFEDACRFIARGSPRFSAIFAARVTRNVDRLEEFPRSGRMVPEVGRPSVREIIVQSYRVIYRLSDDRVQILFIHHGARRLPDIDP
jgi:toxin ParE1/3/4